MKITRITMGVAAAALLVLLGGTNAVAQSTANGSASIQVSQVLYIDVTNTTVAFDPTTAADFNTGSVTPTSASSSLTHRGNVPHDVTIAADAANFSSSSGTNDGVKPASDLEWSKDAGTSWAGLTTAGTDIVTGASRGAHDNAETIDYRILLDYATDAPVDATTSETYTLDFTYTVVAN